MRVCIIGAGYVGLVTAAVLADTGNEVAVVEKDREKLWKLEAGRVPFYEAGLEELINKVKNIGNLTFTEHFSAGVSGAEIIMIAVGTPSGEDGRCDLKALEEVTVDLALLPPGNYFIAIKSTVPVGTSDWIEDYLRKTRRDSSWEVASNPEFLRQGTAIKDTMEADRIVIGVSSKKAAQILKDLYKPLGRQVLTCDRRSAEMIKYASNVFLACKVSFINEIADICEQTGADVTMVARGMAMDHRIGGAFLGAGIGFGGSCLPKDLASLIYTAKQHGVVVPMLNSIKEVNMSRRMLPVERLKNIYADLSGRSICVWGLAFKPRTDDLRDAPSIDIVNCLIRSKALVRVYDPMKTTCKKMTEMFPQIKAFNDPYEAAAGADAIVLVTEWEEFRQINWKGLRELVNIPLVLDCRNLFEPAELIEAGFNYMGIGRESFFGNAAKEAERAVV